jgi:hypothetical protein
MGADDVAPWLIISLAALLALLSIGIRIYLCIVECINQRRSPSAPIATTHAWLPAGVDMTVFHIGHGGYDRV